MSYGADFEELAREAGERRLARRAWTDGGSFDADVVVRWGLDEDEGRVADLLELNGIPRWAAFEERFVVAEKDGEVLAAVRYRTEPKRLVLELLVADPWAGERALARTLYAGAGELAREMGAREVLVPAGAWAYPRGYPGEAGYRRWGRGWRLDATRDGAGREELPAGGWRRVVAMFGVVPVPFFRAFDR